MNTKGRKPRSVLGLCPKCGMDSGQRMVKEGPDEKYLVICESCGYHTHFYTSMSSASKEWNNGKALSKMLHM